MSDAIDCEYCGAGVDLPWHDCPLRNSPCGKLQAEISALRTEVNRLRMALKTVGDDYPGSSCQKWCYEQAGYELETPNV